MSLIVDIGSYTTKFGEAGSEIPIEFRTCLCTQRYPNSMFASLGSFQQKQLKLQQQEQILASSEYRGLYKMRNVVPDNGRVHSSEDFIKVLNYVKSQFRQQIQKITLILPPLTSETVQKQVQQYLFEQINVQEVLISTGGAFALYTTGRTEGMLLNVGDTTSFVQPVLNNQSVLDRYQISNIGGRQISQMLLKQVYSIQSQFGYVSEATGNESYDLELIYDLKHKLADFSAPANTNVSYELPDGATMNINRGSIQNCCNILFNKEQEQQSLTELIKNSVKEIPTELHHKLYKNLVVSGGSTLINGFGQKLLDELKAQKNTEIEIFGSKNRSIAAFQGASACAMLSGFAGFYIRKE
ncbi:Actin [Hexamita inflata]|uniref:Actin n=1 Tax=Hexamita inflata TaxID=28002 RepID=A0AA86U999_9EUKA|nr:Actin [Hexamita inflata]